jgi:hypothetical protein
MDIPIIDRRYSADCRRGLPILSDHASPDGFSRKTGRRPSWSGEHALTDLMPVVSDSSDPHQIFSSRL